jgi:hypothetical protein
VKVARLLLAVACVGALVSPAGAQERADAAPDAPVDDEASWPWLRVEAEGGVLHRELTYTDDLFLVLRDYTLPAAFVARLGVELGLGALFGVEPTAGLTLFARGEWAPGVRSNAGSEAFPTRVWALDGAVRWWFRVAPVSFGPEVGYQRTVFELRDADSGVQRPDVPTLAVDALRLGALIRADVGLGLYGTLRGAYLLPFDVGEMDDAGWFPRAQAHGLDLEVEVGWGNELVEVAVVGAWRRWAYAMNPEPGDARVAGGAADDTLVASGRVRFLLR